MRTQAEAFARIIGGAEPGKPAQVAEAAGFGQSYFYYRASTPRGRELPWSSFPTADERWRRCATWSTWTATWRMSAWPPASRSDSPCLGRATAGDVPDLVAGRTVSVYCSAPSLDRSKRVAPRTLRDVKYDLMRIGYDPEADRWGEPELVLSAATTGLSILLPPISPGRQVPVVLHVPLRLLSGAAADERSVSAAFGRWHVPPPGDQQRVLGILPLVVEQLPLDRLQQPPPRGLLHTLLFQLPGRDRPGASVEVRGLHVVHPAHAVQQRVRLVGAILLATEPHDAAVIGVHRPELAGLATRMSRIPSSDPRPWYGWEFATRARIWAGSSGCAGVQRATRPWPSPRLPHPPPQPCAAEQSPTRQQHEASADSPGLGRRGQEQPPGSNSTPAPSRLVGGSSGLSGSTKSRASAWAGRGRWR